MPCWFSTASPQTSIFAPPNPVTGKPGWWEHYVGAGKAINTNRYYVICANVLGGSMGSYGPKSLKDGKALGLDFPLITIHDMVRAQALLLEQLGIERLAAVVGGSMGGMQALSFAIHFPEKTRAVLAIATSARHSAQNIAFHEIGRQAIMVDSDWLKGRYYDERRFPAKGLAVARMAAHVTYLSDAGLQEKFGRGLQDRASLGYGFEADFKVESYLRYQGSAFVQRFDPNSYFYITRAMDYFDITDGSFVNLSENLRKCQNVRFGVISFSSDWLFSPEESRHIVRALNAVGAPVSYAEIQTDLGHDAFLLPNVQFESVMRGFMESL